MKSLPTEPLEFAAVIAHQLKSPVTSVASILQTLLGEFAGPLNPKQRELVEKSLNRCKESITAATRLLAIAKAIQTPEFFKGTANIAHIAHNITSRYKNQALEHNIDFHVNIDTENKFVRGYEPALDESLDAILNNAFKYTPEHGRIRLTVTHDSSTDRTCISIADSGVGIGKKDRKKIFEPFFRTVSADHSSRPGTGLGLTFVKAVIDAIEGNIAVQSSDMGGTEFIITLPIIQPVESPAEGMVNMKKNLRVIIIGGVAAGPKVASKIMRLDSEAEVTIIDKGKLLSYSGCGLPYYISGVVKDQKGLISSSAGIVRDPVFFQKVKNVRVMNQTEALEIDRKNKKILVHDSINQKDSWLEYDNLVLATGATPIKPEVPGIDLKNIFALHGVVEAEGIKAELETGRSHDVVIIGGGLIGIEITEALVKKGCRVTIVEKRSQILRILDEEMAKLVEGHLESQGVKVMTNTQIDSFEGQGKVQSVRTSKGILPADMVIVGIGSKPNVTLAEKAGLQIGSTGAIKVDEYQRTSDAYIYAAGDCVETNHRVDDSPCYIPLGSTANKQGRVAAINICKGVDRFPGVLGTIACKAFDFRIARTGFTEDQAQRKGYQTITALVPALDTEHFIPGSKSLIIKLVVDRKNRRLLGTQAIGAGQPDKRIDVASLALVNKMTIDQLANMDLCYAPPISPVLDNLIMASNVARNKINGHMEGISAFDVYKMIKNNDNIFLIDVRSHQEFSQDHLVNAVNIPLGVLREKTSDIPEDKTIITICNTGLRAYEASLVLKGNGFENVKVMEGGLEMWIYKN